MTNRNSWFSATCFRGISTILDTLRIARYSVMSADNSEKKLSDVFSSWHVNEEDKKLIPIIQSVNDEQRILCILGSFLGYKNWIVKQDLL